MPIHICPAASAVAVVAATGTLPLAPPAHPHLAETSLAQPAHAHAHARARAMSRRYPTAELYEERERDFYRNGKRSDRNYEELDLELRRGSDPRRSAPDLFRDDRTAAGPMVLRGRDRDEDTFSRAPPRSRRSGFDDEDDAITIRSRPPPPPSSARERDMDDFSLRRSDTGGRGRREVEREKEELDVTIRRREQSRGPPPSEARDRDRDIPFRRGDGARPREVSLERDDVRFRGRDRDGGIDVRATHKEFHRDGRDASAERGSIRFQERDGNFDIRASRREFSRSGRDRSVERDSLVIRGRERSMPPPSSRGELIAREHEEFVVRRPREQSRGPREREVIKDEIVIRRMEERSPSPEPLPPPPPPPPMPEPEIRPPIIQEIITHHRHIDHGRPAWTRLWKPCYADQLQAWSELVRRRLLHLHQHPLLHRATSASK